MRILSHYTSLVRRRARLGQPSHISGSEKRPECNTSPTPDQSSQAVFVPQLPEFASARHLRKHTTRAANLMASQFARVRKHTCSPWPPHRLEALLNSKAEFLAESSIASQLACVNGLSPSWPGLDPARRSDKRSTHDADACQSLLWMRRTSQVFQFLAPPQLGQRFVLVLLPP